MHSNLIKIIHTVISFLLWKALGTFLLHLPGLGLPKIGISTLTGFLLYWVENYSIHPQVFPKMWLSFWKTDSKKVKQVIRHLRVSLTLPLSVLTCGLFKSLWTSVSPFEKCSSNTHSILDCLLELHLCLVCPSNTHPVLRSLVRISFMPSEPSLKAAKGKIIIIQVLLFPRARGKRTPLQCRFLLGGSVEATECRGFCHVGGAILITQLLIKRCIWMCWLPGDPGPQNSVCGWDGNRLRVCYLLYCAHPG